ncbi:hypothetical protein MG293_006026 [Ovis ammon polii]|uniref:Uncharacterized protein n=1 Tax=Ovis ammon polii TaxID=230172 RepID=A0AAD4UEP3_OVIAM|nr:hypothetical protein MG293_006026 [Ovis ammon polii]
MTCGAPGPLSSRKTGSGKLWGWGIADGPGREGVSRGYPGYSIGLLLLKWVLDLSGPSRPLQSCHEHAAVNALRYSVLTWTTVDQDITGSIDSKGSFSSCGTFSLSSSLLSDALPHRSEPRGCQNVHALLCLQLQREDRLKAESGGVIRGLPTPDPCLRTTPPQTTRNPCLNFALQ